MKFSFDVGDGEIHRVDFRFNQFWGNLNIDVDGRRQIDDLRTFSFNLTEAYQFIVGNIEKHTVRIEKRRKLLFAGYRNAHYSVYIDDVLSKEMFLNAR